MYSEKARARRRCTARRKDGTPCQAYACWDDPAGRCMAHAGRHHTGRIGPKRLGEPHQHARYAPCTCRAYPWPHRPGGGTCTAPELEEEVAPEVEGSEEDRRLAVQALLGKLELLASETRANDCFAE